MELSTALTFLAILAATAVSFYLIYRPVLRERKFEELRQRLNWRQGNAPQAPRYHFRITYHA
jgi:hypothetical protein